MNVAPALDLRLIQRVRVVPVGDRVMPNDRGEITIVAEAEPGATLALTITTN